MAQLIYRVTGRRGEERVSQTFRSTDEGRKAASALAAELENARTGYDVRTRIAGRVVTRTFKRRKDADAYAATIEADKLRGVAVDPRSGRLTVEELVDRWLAANPAKRSSTMARDRSAASLYVVPAIGAQTISSVTPANIQALVSDWSRRRAPRTVRRTYDVLRASFAFAVANDWLARSPCRGIKLPQITGTRRHDLTPEQVIALAQAVGEDYSAAIYLGGVLGLRWGEVAGLRVGRLDLLGQKLTVAEQITRGEHGRQVIGLPKSLAGTRTLALPAWLVELLAEHLARRGLTAAVPEAYVFVMPGGGPLDYSHWRRRVWLPACRAEECEGAAFHDLRRTAATLLVLEGVDVKTAQVRLGHSDVRLTFGLYPSAVAEADRSAAEAVGAYFQK